MVEGHAKVHFKGIEFLDLALMNVQVQLNFEMV